MPNDTDRITELLQQAKTIAVVGLSDNLMRISYDVSEYMQRQGYRITPSIPPFEARWASNPIPP